MTITIHCDGLCEPRNPGGYACWAWIVTDPLPDMPPAQDFGCVAKGKQATNNLAEYTAVGKALRYCVDQGIFAPTIRTDSQLVVRQINGDWACNAEHLKPLMKRARALLNEVGGTLEWVPREQNEIADNLSRIAYQQAIPQHELY